MVLFCEILEIYNYGNSYFFADYPRKLYYATVISLKIFLSVCRVDNPATGILTNSQNDVQLGIYAVLFARVNCINFTKH